MQRNLAIVAFVFGLFGAVGSVLNAQNDTGAYTLGPGDRFALKVVVWNDELRSYEQWGFFASEYMVQADGSTLIPLVGRVESSGKTAFELSNDVAQQLRSAAGLIQPVSVSVEVSKFRPFYVAGDVSSPGEYEMRPGLSVVQAHALSGGRNFARSDQGSALAAFRDNGSLRQTLGEIARTRVRLARLEAERVGAESVEYPSLVHPDGENALSLIINAENEIFDSRRTALSLEISNLEELKKLLENEVSSLEAKLEGHREQVELAAGNLENIKTLVERGVSRNAPLLDAQRSLFQLESQGLDLEDGIFRARQRINEADRDIVALESRRQSEVNRDLQNNQGQYESLLIRAETLRRVIEENGAATVAIDAALTVTEYSITRNIDGQAQVIKAEPGDPILPGDVLTVEQILVNEE